MTRLRTGLMLLGAVLLAGCGSRSEPQTLPAPRPLQVALAGGPSGVYAPLWGAIASGGFALGDLNVAVNTTPDPLHAIESNTAAVAIVSEAQLMSARAGGAQIMSIGALLQSPPAVPHGGSDPTVGLLQAQQTTFQSHGGAPAYSPYVIVVPLFRIHYDGPLLRAFLQSLMRGAAWAKANPAPTAAAIERATKGLNPAFELALTNSAAAVSQPTATGVPYGFQQDATWQTFGNWLHAQGLISTNPSGGNALTDEFLPGEGI